MDIDKFLEDGILIESTTNYFSEKDVAQIAVEDYGFIYTIYEDEVIYCCSPDSEAAIVLGGQLSKDIDKDSDKRLYVVDVFYRKILETADFDNLEYGDYTQKFKLEAKRLALKYKNYVMGDGKNGEYRKAALDAFLFDIGENKKPKEIKGKDIRAGYPGITLDEMGKFHTYKDIYKNT